MFISDDKKPSEIASGVGGASAVPNGQGGSRFRAFIHSPWTIGLTVGIICVLLAALLAGQLGVFNGKAHETVHQLPTGTVIVPAGIYTYLAATTRGDRAGHLEWQDQVKVRGYCIGEPTRPAGTKAVLDERWLILTTGELIEAWAVYPNVTADLVAGRCPGSDRIAGPKMVTLVAHREGSRYRLSLGVRGGTSFGLVLFDRQHSTWRPRLLQRETGRPATTDVSISGATAALAVACWATGNPAYRHQVLVGKLVMFGGLTQRLSHSVEVAVPHGAEVACAGEEYGYTKTQVPVQERRQSAAATRPALASPRVESVETYSSAHDQAQVKEESTGGTKPRSRNKTQSTTGSGEVEEIK
jgi:hypothetical protein